MLNRKTAVIAMALFAAFSVHATGQYGESNAKNTQAPPPANHGTTNNNGIGIGVQSSSAATALSNQAVNVRAKGGKAAAIARGGDARGGAGGYANQAMNGVGNSTVTVEGAKAPRIPVATAYSAGLVASPGTCLGSASAGVQGAAIGLSIGSTTRDDGCHLIRRAVLLDQMGQPDAALALACLEDDNIREAMTRVGRSCSNGGLVSATWNVRSPNPIVAVAPVYRAMPAKMDRN